MKYLSFSGLLYFYVIAGLDPAIQIDKEAIWLTWIPGSQPGDDKRKKSLGMTKKNKVPEGDKKKNVGDGSYDRARMV